MKKYLIEFILIFIFASDLCCQTHLEPSQEEINQILPVMDLLSIGFPLNEQGWIENDRGSFEIAKAIYDFHSKGFLNQDVRNNYLDEIIEKNISIINTFYNGMAIMNYESLSDRAGEHEIDLNQTIASIILCDRMQRIDNITPLLKLSLIYYGRHSDANAIPGIILSIKDDVDKTELTDEERLTFWPAAHAILFNPSISIPLLAKAVNNEQLDEILRLRASAFLLELDSDIFKTTLDELDESSIKNKIQCIMDKNINWKNVHINVCETNLEKLIWWENVKKRK